VGNSIRDDGAVVIDPHGLTRRDSNTGACGVLYRDRAISAVIDDVGFVDLAPGTKHKVISRSRSTCQVKAHVARRLRSIGIGQRQRDISVGERN
jgi:hypothetical protein